MSENYETKLIGIQNGRNFRELGGYKTVSGQTIKYNKLVLFNAYPQLFRSDDNSSSFNFIAIPNENTTFLLGI